MGWFGPSSGDCSCCGEDCTGCDSIDQLIVSGLGSSYGNCNTACSGRNGTYNFRSSPWTSSGGGEGAQCGGWGLSLGSNNCGLLPSFPADRWGIGSTLCGSLSLWSWTVQLGTVSGVWTATVRLAVSYYELKDADSSNYTTANDTQYQFVWKKTGASCADLTGTLTLDSTSTTVCRNLPAGTGAIVPDVCAAGSATIELA